MRQRCIITADDFGFSPGVNGAIEQAARSGAIDAASVMVNMPYATAAIAAIVGGLTPPALSLGLHFCLTSGKSVAPRESVPLLVDEDGMFRHGFVGLWRLLAGRNGMEARRQIQAELAAQFAELDRLLASHGLTCSHLDSHQHVHVIGGIFEPVALESLKRKLRLRIPYESFGSLGRIWERWRHWVPGGVAKRAVLNWHLGGAWPEIGYFGVLDTGRMDDAALQAIFRTVAKKPLDRRFEINVHPSLGDGGEATCCSREDAAFHKSPWRRREWETLIRCCVPSQ